MTTQEFKAWFEGFTECIEGTPSKKQWERIKNRVAEIDGVMNCTTPNPTVTVGSFGNATGTVFHQLGAVEFRATDQ